MTPAKKARYDLLRCASISITTQATVEVLARSQNTVMSNGRMLVAVALDGVVVGETEFYQDATSGSQMLQPNDMLVGYITAAMHSRDASGQKPSKECLRSIWAKIKTACAVHYHAVSVQ